MIRPIPFTVPYASPIYGRPPYYMVEGRILIVSYEVDPDAAAASVSPPLNHVTGTQAALFIGDMLQLPHCGKFHECGVVLTASYASPWPGSHWP
jgi:acetoacetate decarboxylase